MITKCPYLCGPDVLFHPDCTVKSIKLDYTSVTDGVIKGGSPINAAGKVANDATAIGVLRRDCYEGYHPRGQVVIGGYVDQDKAQANSGIVLAGEAKAAMAKVLLLDASGVPQLGAPEGYPYIKKIYTPLLEEQEYKFRLSNGAHGTDMFAINPQLVVGQTYRVIFDGEQYECVCLSLPYNQHGLGNFKGMGLEDTGEPFAIVERNAFATIMSYDTASSHTIGVWTVEKTVEPMAEKFMPVLTAPNGTKYKLTVDDTGTLSATEVT